MKHTILLSGLLFMVSYPNKVAAQKTDANIFGDVKSNGEHLPFASILIEGKNIGTTTDQTGHYMLVNLPEGEFELTAQMVGYMKQTQKVSLKKGVTLEVNFELKEEVMSLNAVVVTGTKTFKRKTESPVIVNVIEGKTLGMIQANTLSEGLCFQPGLRVETDCQTCNYSQLRMNGLGGSYSQILINSRPVFSPLTGLYGMEQIPANMVDRIEVVRGGGSALYGSSAIGGTVNIITKIPDQNAYEVSANFGRVDKQANDNQVNASLNVLSPQRNAGLSFFASRRQRDDVDVNGDQFSEMPSLKNNSFGLTAFLKPTPAQKLEFNFSSLYEYRYGGEMTDKAAYLAQQSEERTHHVMMGGLDYEIDFNGDRSALILYMAGQNTLRKHYTGIMPDASDSAAYARHFINPPYGNTDNTTFQGGLQLNHNIEHFLKGTNRLTIGAEVSYDDVFDEIPAYAYTLDQTTTNTGMFVQSDWQVFKGFTLLSGVRADKHNLVDKVIFNPRFSVLYRLGTYTQFRASWAAGFRAPQAFDADMHIAFAGGGVSRIRLADNLKAEKSNSYSVSVNHDRATETYIVGFTAEGFYTVLNNAFMLEEAGSDGFGMIYEKRNANSSIVKGCTFELRGNFRRKIQLEAGYTVQSSYYKKPVAYSASLEAIRKYLRTPDAYGYYTLTITPTENFSASLSGVYTGSMEIVHMAGAPENPDNDIRMTTPAFFENNFKIGYLIRFESLSNGLEIFGGVKNLSNAFQQDFDSGKNRDSNYVYGPAMPRMFYVGVKIRSIQN